MARQRYCRRLTRYRNTLRVSADPVAKPAAQTRAESRFSTFESYCGRETDCLLEGDGFELPVPEREDRVSSLGLLLAKDRGVGADVSVQPGFVIIMPSPLEASGAPLCCAPVDPEDDERDQAPTIRAICRRGARRSQVGADVLCRAGANGAGAGIRHQGRRGNEGRKLKMGGAKGIDRRLPQFG